MSKRDQSTDTDAASTDLPVPVDSSRTYIGVQPTDSSLNPASVTTHIRRLHQLGSGVETGLLDRLGGKTRARPTIECLLVSDGGSDSSIRYAFGIDDDEAVSTLERVLRGLFPDTYELTREVRSTGYIQSILGEDPESIQGVDFCGRVERRADWQTQLTPFEQFIESDEGRVPLAAVVETMATADCPMVYQALIQPKPDWSTQAEARIRAIEAKQDTIADQVVNAVFGAPDEDLSLGPGDETRLEELASRDTRRSFVVNARLAATVEESEGDDAGRALRELTSAFGAVSHTSYEIEGRLETSAENLYRDMCGRAVRQPTHEKARSRVPWSSNRSAGIVADATEVASFCLMGGDALTTAGARGVSPTPGERTSLPRPPFEQLTNYRDRGLLLGTAQTQDGTSDATELFLPPSLQPLHVGWFGKTGSGKSTSLINAMLSNHEATAGADILIDPKGDGMATEYLRAHYAAYGTLENVLYFDCADVLPAFSFFDIRDELEAGVPRSTAVEDRVDHYIEILTQIIGKDRFEQAVRSPDIIRYLIKAMFDPVSGYDAFSHRDLHTAVRQMHERQAAPAVSDPDLERMLAGVIANRPRSFDNIMQGVANRIEKIPVDRRLARVFNHVVEPDTPAFDLADYLDEDVVIIVDTGGLRSEAQRVLTLVILSNLWTALRRRANRQASDDRPLVNLYIEEAASVAVSDLLKQLLAQSRGFGCSVTLAMQFPAQLRAYGDDVYDEVLNNVSTLITGNVPADKRLAERLATDEMSPQAVGNRLRALRRGQWLARLPAGFDAPEPRPFLVTSAPLPPGHEEGQRPLSATEEAAFESNLDAVTTRTLDEAGLRLTLPSVPGAAGGDDDAGHEADTGIEGASDATGPGEQAANSSKRIDSALPYTQRLPAAVEYSESLHALECSTCHKRYNPTIEGMRRAISCCASLDDIDRDDVPVCAVNLKLTPEERAVLEWSDTQLMFVQTVYNAQQLRYDPLEYDLVYDSMIRLQEYIGIETADIHDLIDADLLRHDTDHPHRMYTVTPEGRAVIGESYRQGVDYGHGVGDLEESSEHVFMNEVLRQHIHATFVESDDSPAVEVIPYYELDDNHRLDVAALDADGNIVVAGEAERVNHDVRRAAPEDYDKLADCDVDHAIWVVMTQASGHKVLDALNDPLDGEPRVKKTYASTTPPQQFIIDTPGLTAMYPIEWLRDTLEDD